MATTKNRKAHDIVMSKLGQGLPVTDLELSRISVNSIANLLRLGKIGVDQAKRAAELSKRDRMAGTTVKAAEGGHLHVKDKSPQYMQGRPMCVETYLSLLEEAPLILEMIRKMVGDGERVSNPIMLGGTVRQATRVGRVLLFDDPDDFEDRLARLSRRYGEEE